MFVRVLPSHTIQLHPEDSLRLYERWPTPVIIISDGPYGIGGFPGDPHDPAQLPAWYEPHVRRWSERATTQTTLWFWNTEVGWALVHPILERLGWEYRACCVWDKGLAHVAGNSNTQSLRQLPVVTEVCVHYVRRPRFQIEGREASMRDWLRHEWRRTGLPLSRTNEAAGVRNAATRKYFSPDRLWYFPPPPLFERLAAFANAHGRPEGRPYFSLDGQSSLTAAEWARFRAKFHCPVGVTNVWSEPPVAGPERLKTGTRALHLNQKPLRLMERLIALASDPGDWVWEPFGGLATAAVAAHNLRRSCVCAEVNPTVYEAARQRLEAHLGPPAE